MNTTRNTAIDIIRGVTLISMIAYHTLWDLVYIFGHEEIGSWYASAAGFVWQQSICQTFILLAGYCTNLGKRTLRRGLTVFACGLVIMAVSAIAMPEARVVFGVLTLIGSGMIIAWVSSYVRAPSQSPSGTASARGADAPSASKRTRQLSPGELTPEGEPRLIRDSLATPERAAMPSFIILLALFAVTYRINEGFILLPFAGRIALPDALYANYLTAYLGFPPEGFFSTDYFSLLPWLFLFFAGRVLYGVLPREMFSSPALRQAQGPEVRQAPLHTPLKPLAFLGRHTLPIYMVHQPVIYGILLLIHL